eukprot:4280292-Pyramimonas_sp.AAC.1
MSWSPDAPMLICTGLFRMSPAMRCTALGHVAVKKSVCRVLQGDRGPIRRRKHRYILTTDQSDAGKVGQYEYVV